MELSLYPEIQPFDQGFLKVSDSHSIYYEQSGRSDGKAIISVHGGPGSESSPRDRRYFDPNHYRIILFDQRGAGKSTPTACLEENTTWHLVDDMEKLRIKLGIEKWILFGGSWGSTLCLAYAETYPQNVEAMILRGIFTLRQVEIDWRDDGCPFIFPDYYDDYRAVIPKDEQEEDLMNSYYKRLKSDDESIMMEASKAWTLYEMRTCTLIPSESAINHCTDHVWAAQMARIECHYFLNKGFLKHENQLLDDVEKIRHIPCTIVHGRYDLVCPLKFAWDLSKRWPEADLQIVPNAGHSAWEPGIHEKLMEACDKYKKL